MKIQNIEEAEQILQAYVPAVSRTGDDQSLDRMWPVLESIGNPQQKIPTIHIAGTSGKTSTSYFIASLLQASGKRVGLTVSPHVDSVTERLQIDGNPIDDVIFCRYLGEFLDRIGDTDLSYFELLIVFVLWVFAEEGVEYIVLETGMGGLFDGTNVVTNQNKVCVITDIGFDHMHVLGETLDKIAFQKAGIIHENNVVFSQSQKPLALREIEKRSSEKSAELTVLSNEHTPNYQDRNWTLARRVAQYTAERDGFTLRSIDHHDVVIPGRMELRELKDGSTLVMDGAHNGQKMTAFVKSFQQAFPEQRAVVLLALKQGKELEEVLEALRPITNRFIATEFASYQDLPFSAIPASDIAEKAKELDIEAVSTPDYSEALSTLQQGEGLKIITGSFYLLGDIRKILK